MLQVTGTRADRLPEPWFTSLSEQLPGLRLFDCHTHLGCADPDGSCFAADELRAALEVVDARAEQLERLLAGADPRDLGAAPSKPAPSPGPLLEWVHTLLVAASVLELLDRHAEYLASDPPRHGPRVPAIHLIFAAAAVARTPGLPLP